MAITDFQNYVFIHIPKTAGSSVTRALRGTKIIETHCHARGVFFHYPDLESLFTFCFIRDPWNRMVSLWKFRMRKEETPKKSFEEWYWEAFDRVTVEKKQTPDDEESISNLRKPQLRWVKALDGSLLADYIGFYENLHSEREFLFRYGEKYQLPHSHKSPNRDDYRSYYTDEIKEQIARDFQEDIEYGGYKFE